MGPINLRETLQENFPVDHSLNHLKSIQHAHIFRSALFLKQYTEGKGTQVDIQRIQSEDQRLLQQKAGVNKAG